MGYIMEAICVDFEEVAKVFGSRDQALVDKLKEEFEDDFDEYRAEMELELEDFDDKGFVDEDEDFVDEDEEDFDDGFEVDDGEEEEEEELVVEDDEGDIDPVVLDGLENALDDIVAGESLADDTAHEYALVLRMLCMRFGEFLDSEHWSAMPSATAWCEEVDKALAAAGVDEKTLRASDHLMCRGAPFPIPLAGEPSIGYLKREEFPGVLAQLDAADLTDCDSAVRDSIRNVRGWLEACYEAGRDLICFT